MEHQAKYLTHLHHLDFLQLCFIALSHLLNYNSLEATTKVEMIVSKFNLDYIKSLIEVNIEYGCIKITS
jgi:hypothetical protein